MHENIFGFEAVCFKLLRFMKELVVFDFNVFCTDRKLTTLEDLLRCCDNSMFQKIETTLPSAATDIGKGLKYFHSKKVLHCNLKPANVWISDHHYRNLASTEERNKGFQDKPTICKLYDFGKSRSMLKQTKSNACARTNAVTRRTLAFMAPVLLPGDKSCVWLWKRLDNVKSEQTPTELIWLVYEACTHSKSSDKRNIVL